MGYCVDSVSFAVIVGRAVGGIDVRKYNSGTAGGANVGRLLGVRYGVLVACLDMANGSSYLSWACSGLALTGRGLVPLTAQQVDEALSAGAFLRKDCRIEDKAKWAA